MASNHIQDNMLYLAYDIDTKQYYIMTSFKNITETDNWLETLETFVGQQIKIERGL